jgi:dethiobiotin synthetase
MRKIFVTGIGTDIGKTLVSAILAEALEADYWKPVQAGTLYATDSENVKKYISNPVSVIHPEAYRLKGHKSPHEAAANENIKIDPDKIMLPVTSNKTLVIEGAGGVMVPLTDNYFILDLIKKFNADVVLVIQNYLGSINHSLLTIDVLKQNKIKISGIVFNGAPHPASEELILNYSALPCILKILKEDKIDKNSILKYAKSILNQPLLTSSKGRNCTRKLPPFGRDGVGY